MKKLSPSLAAFALTIPLLGACGGQDTTGSGGSGGSGGSASCPNDLPEKCPSPEPSYAADIAPLVEARCLPCHSAGGPASGEPLGTYALVHDKRSAVLNQVYACKMPPPGDAEPLDSTERATLLAWLICGANDN